MKFLPLTVLPPRHYISGQLAALFWLTAWVTLYSSLPALARPTASTTVVISQVYGGGGNSGAPYTNDFIELHNISGTNIDLTGYSVQYSSSGGNTWQVTALSGTIRAGGFYLIQQAAGTTVTNAPLPMADATGSISLASNGGKVALVSNATALTGTCPTASVVDFVGYGGSTSTASFCFEGAGPTAAPSNTTSVLRKSSGCQDTNNNGADFTTGTPTPRNSATGDNYYCVTAAGTISPTSGQAGTVLTISGGLLSAITSVTVAGVPATNVAATASTVTATVASGTPLGAATVVLSDGTNSYTANGTFTVTTTSLSTPTLNATVACPGGTVGVTFTASGTYDPANVFTVELSDASGTFPATPNVVGSAANVATTAQTIMATLPAATAGGTAYRLRVVASNPATTSAPSAALTVNTVRVTPTATQNIYTATTGTALTATETGTPTGRQWAYATASGGPYTDLAGQTGPSYTPAFSTVGTYYVVVKSTFACGVQLSNEVIVNVSAAQLPTITSFSPSAGPAGTTVTITGTNFITGASVAFNGTAAAQLTLVSATQLRATAPTGVTTGPLTVTTAGGTATSTTPFTASSRTLALLDDFNRANDNAVGNGWTETETAATGATLASNQLRLASSTAGRELVTRNIATRYSPELGSNEQVLTWAWNMQQSRSNPSGFDAGGYGAVFVLAASNANLLTGTGYAVVVGNSGTPDPIKLVRFANGFSANSSLTDIIVGSANAGSAPQTIRVTYLPDENTWTLEAGTSQTAFQDPGAAATAYTTLGSAVDATYTGSSLPYIGCLWNHGTSTTDYALFDNIYLTAPCLPEADATAGPTAAQAGQLTSSSAALSWTAGTGSSRLVLVRPGTTGTDSPSDGSSYPAGVYGQGAVAGTSYSVYAGNGTSVTVTGLAASTTYSYSVYEATGVGCSLNYLQASPATGTFTTAACLVAAAPTQPASAAQATASGSYSLNLSWQNGNGSQRLVVVAAGQAPTAGPQDATAYTASGRFGAGAALGGGYVVYAGTGSSASVSGLTSSTTYYVAVYEFNGSGCSAAYLLSGAPTAQATTLAPPPPGTYRFYRGNLHGHSAYSDGNKDAGTSGAATPADDYALARTAQQFDFMGLSEHNHRGAGMELPRYALGLAQADAATVDGTFVALYGMEWGTISGGGHVIVYNYPRLIGWEAGNYDDYVAKGDYSGTAGLFTKVAQQPGAVAYLAHPSSTDYNNFFSSSLNATTAEVLVGSAMRSGPAFSTNTTYSDASTSTYEARFKDALKLGYHVAPTIDHDSHNSVFGRSTPGRLVLLAAELTRPALLDALQQRRFYAADDFNAEVTFQISNSPMGSTLTQAGAPTLTVSVNDPDGNDAVASIAVFSGIPGSNVQATQLGTMLGSASYTLTDNIPDGAIYYYYAVITQADGDKLWTAPIWYTRQDATGTPLPVQLLSFQAVLHNEYEAVLRWATASEQHSAYFVVERSLNGQRFVEAGRLTAAGTSAQTHAYQLRDPRLLTGLTYYRLRQVDLDGTTSYSPVVTLAPSAREAAQVNVYPNPSAGATVAHLALRGLDGEQVSVRVVDMLGRTVATRQLIPLGYQADAPLALPDNLPAGVYVVTVATATRTWSLRWTLEPR